MQRRVASQHQHPEKLVHHRAVSELLAERMLDSIHKLHIAHGSSPM
jgi:hypothetical protein